MGSNSFFGKIASQDPIARWANSAGVGKFISPIPGMNVGAIGNAYANRNTVGSSPTPFAGVQPTLQDANNGYVQQAQRAVQQQRPVGQARYPTAGIY